MRTKPMREPRRLRDALSGRGRVRAGQEDDGPATCVGAGTEHRIERVLIRAARAAGADAPPAPDAGAPTAESPAETAPSAVATT